MKARQRQDEVGRRKGLPGWWRPLGKAPNVSLKSWDGARWTIQTGGNWDLTAGTAGRRVCKDPTPTPIAGPGEAGAIPPKCARGERQREQAAWGLCRCGPQKLLAPHGPER